MLNRLTHIYRFYSVTMENSVLVLSEDGTIQYQKLTSKYLEDTLRVTREVILLTGNTCNVLGISQDPVALSELEQLPRAAAKDGISVIAVDKKTDKVVGVSLNKFLSKSQPFFENFSSKFKSFKNRQWLEFLIGTHKMYDVFEYCKVDCIMQILFLSVEPDYRKRGIAQKLCELSVERAQKLQDGINVKESVDGSVLSLEPVPEVVYAMFTSFISQKIGRELGFEKVAERSMTRMELLGQVIENPSIHTPIMTLEYKMLHKRTE